MHRAETQGGCAEKKCLRSMGGVTCIVRVRTEKVCRKVGVGMGLQAEWTRDCCASSSIIKFW